MNATPILRRIVTIACAFLAVTALIFAADPTVFLFTKKRQTDLLESPRSREKPVATVPFREKLKVLEKDGVWIKVEAKSGSGWVYEGNLAPKQPPADVNLEFLPGEASPTSVSVAARPLGEVAKNYAVSKGKKAAAEDVEWLERESGAITAAEVDQHLAANKKGEYQ